MPGLNKQYYPSISPCSANIVFSVQLRSNLHRRRAAKLHALHASYSPLYRQITILTPGDQACCCRFCGRSRCRVTLLRLGPTTIPVSGTDRHPVLATVFFVFEGFRTRPLLSPLHAALCRESTEPARKPLPQIAQSCRALYPLPSINVQATSLLSNQLLQYS
jgi:hypothetical protein